MKQFKDRAIVLSRIDYGEKDRILTLLCAEHGKVSVLAKSVRSQKSRLAGGIELLSESEVSFVQGKSSLMTLTSARLKTHFSELVTDVFRMQQAFSHIKTINSITDAETGQEYYNTLLLALGALNSRDYDRRLVDIWFNLQILNLSGSSPNLHLQTESDAQSFEFNYDKQQFLSAKNGPYSQNDLKVMRVCLSQEKPPRLQHELGSEDRLQTLTQTLLRTNVTEL